MEMKKFNYMLEIDILRNSSQKNVGVLMGVFKGFGCSKDSQTPCWLRLCSMIITSEQQPFLNLNPVMPRY